MPKYLYFVILVSSLSPNAVQAAEDIFALCKPLTLHSPPRPALPPPQDEAVHVFADEATIDEHQGISTFSGDVLVQRAAQIVRTPVITYDRSADRLEAEGDFTLWDKHFIVSGRGIKLYAKDRGRMQQADYWLLSRRARGHAEKVLKKSEDLVGLEGASYTTCDPDREVWRLDSERTILDNTTATGTASHVVIRLLGMPVFYTPYLSFPLNDARKSGFLFPNIGSSDETGTEFSLPYYWNLAPHYDATLTPRLMSRRGVLLKTAFRYLTPSAGGRMTVEYMPHDKAFGGERASLHFEHRGPLKNRWYTDVNLNYTSDVRYFEELGNNISVASTTHLERRADLLYLGAGWQALGRLQNFQTLIKDPQARPYERLPQLLFKTTLPEWNRRFNTALQAEFVSFDRDTTVVPGPIGQRFDLKTTFSFPWRTPSTFVIPRLSLRYTRYDLEQTETNDTPDRGLFTFSTDSGLFLEREHHWFATDLIQTLEPRLFYRYTPYRDQGDIPLFDTARYDLSFGQLFREESYSGPDRIDDNHQLTTALTSRLLGSNTGIEHLRASIGQIHYFRDRRVTLPGESTATQTASNLIFEVGAQVAKYWEGTATLHWDPDTQNTERSLFRLRYQSDQDHIVNLSYRLRDDLLEQTDLSWHWSLGSRWQLLGRWNYALPDEITLETFFGLEYSSCCWAIRGITRRYLNNEDGQSYLNGFFLQLELKGLGGIGKKADSFLEQRIPGYHDEF